MLLKKNSISQLVTEDRVMNNYAFRWLDFEALLYCFNLLNRFPRWLGKLFLIWKYGCYSLLPPALSHTLTALG